MRTIKTSLFAVLFLYLQLNAQMISKWDRIFDGKDLAKKYNLYSFEPVGLTVYDKNHFSFLDHGYGIYESPVLHLAVFIDGRDTNVLKLKSSSSESGYLIKSINYTDSTTIYCLVDSSRWAYTDGINRFFRYITFVYKSTDGGKSWTVYPTQQNLSLRKRPSLFLRMTDSLHGILAQLPDTLENYDRILLTTDGWKTYKEVKTNKFYLSREGFYSPPIVAIFTGRPHYDLWISKDDGNSWDTLSFSGFNESSRNVIFVNDSLWYFSGYHKELNSRVLLKTKNHGVSWDTLLTLPSADTTSYIPLYPPFDEKHITTIIDKKYAYTKDLGKSWKYITLYTYYDNMEFYVFLSYYDGKIGYGSGSPTNVLAHISVEMYTGDSILAPPRILEPKDYYKIPMNFVIKWSKVEGAESYRLQIAEGPGSDLNDPTVPLPSFETDLIIDTILTDTTYQIINTKYYKTYFCRVLAKNEKYTSPWISKYFVTIKQQSSVDEQNQVAIKSILIEKHKSYWNANLVLEEIRGSTLFNILGIPVCYIYSEEDIKKLPNGIYLLRKNNEINKIIVLD